MKQLKKPRYPIYIPSKNRADVCYTAQIFLEDGVEFKIVIEPAQVEAYLKHYPEELLLVLPEDDMRLLGSRLWIREHSIANGYDRHWQFDDNIRDCYYMVKGVRERANFNLGISLIEDFTDRYTNIGLSGFNYKTFVSPDTRKPYYLNVHVYSATLVNNRMPYKWRLLYNDDTDICLQVLDNGMCTVLVNQFSVEKMRTMTVKGGNNSDLYQGDGRLVMARSLEEVWPQYVETKWRFGRAQHVVKENWKMFKQPLQRRTDIDWDEITNTKWNIKRVNNQTS
jgi:hypothetical protein